MEVYTHVRKIIQDFRISNPSPSPADTVAILEQLENQILNISSSVNDRLHETHNRLHEKNDKLVKALQDQIDIAEQLRATKDSSQKVIKYLNMLMKAGTCAIARTIIEMIVRDRTHAINLSVETLMQKFRVGNKYPQSDRSMMELIREARQRSFWTRLTTEERHQINLYEKWQPFSKKKNFIPADDVLKVIWQTMEPSRLITHLTDPKVGPFSENPKVIEESFCNLYGKLSSIIHHSEPHYDEDKLPIPAVTSGQFEKADVLALANFYHVSLPNMEYEIVPNVIHASADTIPFSERPNFNNSPGTRPTTIDATAKPFMKRKLSIEHE